LISWRNQVFVQNRRQNLQA